jgi:ABC-2 type transport system permease protein
VIDLLMSEWYKLRKNRAFLFLFGLLCFIAILLPFQMIHTVNASITVNEMYHSIIVRIYSEVLLVCCILAGFFITNEYAMGTMKSIVSSGHSRASIFIAKWSQFTIGVIIFSLIFPIIMTTVSALYIGVNQLPELSFYLKTVGLIILYSIAFASIMACFSFWFTNYGLTIGFLLLFFIFSNRIFEILASNIPFFKPLYTHSVFYLKSFIPIIDKANHPSMVVMTVIPIITSIVFIILGILLFQRKDIK